MQAWIDARLDADGRVQLAGDSDSVLTRGLAAILVHSLSGLTPQEVLAVEPAALAGLVGDLFLGDKPAAVKPVQQQSQPCLQFEVVGGCSSSDCKMLGG